MFAFLKHDQAATPEGKSRRSENPDRETKATEHKHPWQTLALRPAAIQPKLTVSQAHDPQEREADQVADRVMRMAMPHSSESKLSFSANASLKAQRKCDECVEEEENKLQRKEQGANRDTSGVAPPLVHQALSSPGQPLDSDALEFMEPRFGHDFSNVRVHTDDQASQSAHAVNALAYTVGRNIVFRERQYEPAMGKGQRLLAHELAHVIQQDPGPVQVARQPEPYPSPAPMPGALPPNPAPPPMPEKKKTTESPSPPSPDEKKAPAKKRAPVGTSGSFKGNPTAALTKWEYVVYQDHVCLGNRKVDESVGGPVIGSWPWMTNNPGDLTGDVKARKEEPNNADSAYRQDKRIWGDPIQRGKSPDSLSAVPGSSGLSAGNTAVAGFAARTDLAIFADRERGRRALKEWIQKYYGDITLAKSVKLHLGPASSHVAGVDDPEKYPKLLQQYLSDKGHAADYVAKTKGADVKSDEWNDVVDAFGYAEGFYNRRAVAGQPGKFQYVENKGIVYRCSGRDPIDVDPAYRDLTRVKNMPQDTPPEVKELLGCE